MASSEGTPAVGTEFCTNPLIRKISFTGSTRVGKLLLREASDTVKRVSMELGGNACFVVFDDADIDEAVDAAMASKFRNAGQTCVCSDRFLLQQSIHDIFVEKLAHRVRTLIVGHGLQPTSQMGPLISVNAVESVQRKVESAIQHDGAILYCQIESPHDMQRRLGGQYYPPTIVTNVSPTSDLWTTETFGPVVPVMKFSTEEEALEIANNVNVGLASYFCTKDLSRAFRFAHRYVCVCVCVCVPILFWMVECGCCCHKDGEIIVPQDGGGFLLEANA
jgi:succinate-semialdehyde dehydrogenase/glutarate-semialdehyde dehydrogenase